MFAKSWRDKIHPPAYVEQLYVGVEGGANNGQPDITLVLRGADLESVKAGAEELARVLEGYPGVSNVLDDLPYGKDQLIFTLTPAGRSLGSDVGLARPAISRRVQRPARADLQRERF